MLLKSTMGCKVEFGFPDQAAVGFEGVKRTLVANRIRDLKHPLTGCDIRLFMRPVNRKLTRCLAGAYMILGWQR